MNHPLTVAAVVVGFAFTPTVAHAGLIPPAGPWPIEVSGLQNPLTGTALPLNGTNATANVGFKVWLLRNGRHQTAITHNAGQPIIVRGTLTNQDTHRRIGGAGVVVVTEDPYAPGWVANTTVFTNLTGRFRAVLPAVSGHRRVAVVYYPDTVSAPLASRRLLVRAKSKVLLQRPYRTRGRKYRFQGQVSAGTAVIPAGGLLVALQARNSQGVWLTTRLAHTTASGLYSIRYTFPARASLRVRVVAPAQGGWNFYAGRSSSRAVHP